MKPTTRRAAVYFAAGLLLAAAVGVAVWAGSTPGQNNRAGFTAQAAGVNDTSEARSTEQEPTSETSSSKAQERGGETAANSSGSSERSDAGEATDSTGMPANAGTATNYKVEDDPYLPPHAVIGEQAPQQQATNVYRPTNVVPQPAEDAAGKHAATTSTNTATKGSAPSSAEESARETASPGEQKPASTKPSPTTEAPSSGATGAPEPSGKAEQASQSAQKPQRANDDETQATDRGDSRQPQPTQRPRTQEGATAPGAAAEAPKPAPEGESAPAESRQHHVPGKENVAGYPKPQEADATAREIVDRFVNRVTQ